MYCAVYRCIGACTELHLVTVTCIHYCESWNANIREDHADMFSFLSDTATMVLHLALLALSHSSLSVAG